MAGPSIILGLKHSVLIWILWTVIILTIPLSYEFNVFNVMLFLVILDSAILLYRYGNPDSDVQELVATGTMILTSFGVFMIILTILLSQADLD